MEFESLEFYPFFLNLKVRGKKEIGCAFQSDNGPKENLIPYSCLFRWECEFLKHALSFRLLGFLAEKAPVLTVHVSKLNTN